MGKVVWVNLDKEKLYEKRLDEKTLRMFVGGVGLGVKILYDNVPPGVDALDPRNILVFATGPVNGTATPGSGTYCVISKSPLTGFVAATQANGFFGARLKQAGYDAIVVQGIAKKPIYLWIHDGIAEIRDAEKLWGTTTFECETKIKEETKQQSASVACIGPSGENQVKYAAIFSDEGHVASTGGLGAVMGSKKLKAIAVYGSMKIPVADEEKLRESVKELMQFNKFGLYGKVITDGGTAATFPILAQLGAVPYKNWTTVSYPPGSIERFAGIRYVFKTKRKPCWACPYNHGMFIEITEGPYKGLEIEETEYEMLAGFGPNIGNLDPATAAYLAYKTDTLGMDGKETSFLVSFIIESYENGLITKELAEGLELRWGNVEAVEKLLEKIAKKEGKLACILAEGLKKASETLGIPDKAVYMKKAAPHIHDTRGMIPALFDQAVSEIGSIQGNTASYDYEVAPYSTIVRFPGYPLSFTLSRASKRVFADSLVICHFQVAVLLPPVMLEPHILNVFRAVTGWKDYSVNEALDTSERVINLARAFNIRHGLRPEDDWPSQRALEPPKDGPVKGLTLKPIYRELLKAYYRQMGWDEETGKPLKSTLERLGLDYVIKDLYP